MLSCFLSCTELIFKDPELFFPYFSALAAASSPLGVIAGALAGHGVATLVTLFSVIN